MIERLPMREFLATYPWCSGGELDYYSTGLIPAVHRSLNDPLQATFPTVPEDLQQAISYWEAACYIMIGLLGWSNPGKGLLWWHSIGRDNHGDPRLALLNELWGVRQLDLLSAWFWSSTSLNAWNFFEPMTAHADAGVCPPILFSPDAEWWATFRQTFTPPPSYPNPYFHGTNALHFLHLTSPWERLAADDRIVVTKASPATMRARLTLGRPAGWLTALSAAADWIGQLGWTVDVLVPGWGWLGTFKRSPVTRLWYQGSHHVHLAGNLHPAGEANVHRWSDADYISGDDILAAPPTVLKFIADSGLKPVEANDGPSFFFQIGEQHRSASGELRTICGIARSSDAEPLYIILMHETGKLATKRAWKAHSEYGPVVNIVYVHAH